MREMMKLSLFVVLGISAFVSAATLFEDNFDGYDYSSGAKLDVQSGGVWQGSGASMTKFVSWAPGLAQHSNGAYGDKTMNFAYTDVGQDDYIVKVQTRAIVGASLGMEHYAVARATDTQYVAAGIIPSGGTDSYARIIDSTGALLGDTWFAGFDATKWYDITLTVNGANVSATFDFAGSSVTLNTTTTILTGSNAGFGGRYQWGYANAYFDNFSVSEIPEPATMLLLGLGGLVGLKRRK